MDSNSNDSMNTAELEEREDEEDIEFTDDDDTEEAIASYLNSTPDLKTLLASTVRPQPNPSPQLQEDIELLKAAAELNLEISLKYKKLQIVFARTLLEVRQKLKPISQSILNDTRGCENGFSYLRCGKPYFKDEKNYAPPDNEDTVLMKKSQMYDFSQVCSVPGWTARDKTELVNALLAASREIRKKELNSQITTLRKKSKTDNIMEIAKLEREIMQLSKKTLTEIALPLEREYDWEALSQSLNRRHTAQEYQALWKLFLHPSVNKSNWSQSEHQELQKIATAFSMQDWDAIATKLNTGRTGYQCFVYYRTNMAENNVNTKWSVEEVEYLQRLIEYFREGSYIPWGRVATAMDNRTKIQIYNKYMRMVADRKGRFLEEEDVVILNCIENQMHFKKIQQYLPGRSADQLKVRYRLLTKLRLSQTWSVEDDKKLVQIMANLDSTSNFSIATEHFPGKDRMHIRSRYITLMKWMKAHPATDIALAPRRGARRLLHGHANITLSDAVANLSKRMEEEVRTKKSTRITRLSSEHDIEVAIMAALMNEIIKEESQRKPDQSEIGEIGNLLLPQNSLQAQNLINLHKILILLNSSLDKHKFQNSKYGKIYQGWGETAPEASLLKVKSYSRINGVKTLDMGDIPDVWGNVTLGATSYVLPPNYATITGCRVLLNHVGAKPTVAPEDEINLSLMARRNSHLREAIRTLKERFTLLFLWPAIISNEGPSVALVKSEVHNPKPKVNVTYLPGLHEYMNSNPDSEPPSKKPCIDFEAKQPNILGERRYSNKVHDETNGKLTESTTTDITVDDGTKQIDLLSSIGEGSLNGVDLGAVCFARNTLIQNAEYTDSAHLGVVRLPKEILPQDSVIATGNNSGGSSSNKKNVQQAFHPSLFITRPTSASTDNIFKQSLADSKDGEKELQEQQIDSLYHQLVSGSLSHIENK